MFNMNEKISHDVPCNDTMWLRKLALNTEKAFNQQIPKRKEVLIEVIYALSKKRSHETNGLKNKEGKVLLIKR